MSFDDAINFVKQNKKAVGFVVAVLVVILVIVIVVTSMADDDNSSTDTPEQQPEQLAEPFEPTKSPYFAAKKYSSKYNEEELNNSLYENFKGPVELASDEYEEHMKRNTLDQSVVRNHEEFLKNRKASMPTTATSMLQAEPELTISRRHGMNVGGTRLKVRTDDSQSYSQLGTYDRDFA